MDTSLVMQFQVMQLQMYTIKLIFSKVLNFSGGNESAMRQRWLKNTAWQ